MEAGFKPSEVAIRLNVTRSTVGQWEKSRARNGTSPKVDNLADLAVLFGVNFEWLATGRGPKRPDTDWVEDEGDVQYNQPPEERRLLNAYRRLEVRRQKALLELIES